MKNSHRIILSGFAVVQDHDESTGKEEDVRIQEEEQKSKRKIRSMKTGGA
jgi:hypothetical protein